MCVGVCVSLNLVAYIGLSILTSVYFKLITVCLNIKPSNIYEDIYYSWDTLNNMTKNTIKSYLLVYSFLKVILDYSF